VTTTPPWQDAFFGVSLILGERLEDAVRAVDETRAAKAGAVLGALRSPSKSVRARAIAGAVAQVHADLDALRLR
jgi:hypothetical protein